MTLAELASPRLYASIEQIEAHPAGSRQHPHAKALLVWNHEHLTECLSSDDNLFAAMCHDELLHHSKILW